MAVDIIWKINGLELELDINDYETAGKYKEALALMAEEEKALSKDGEMTDIIKTYALLFYNLFDRLFGEGTGDKIFGGKYNTRICDEVYDSFLAFVNRQTVEAQAFRAALVNKYRPNRAARRAQK